MSKEELMAFVGLVIAMGIVSLPSLTDYWSIEPMHCHSWFRLVMPHDRFIQILRYIHVVHNNTALSRTDPQFDKLWKIRPLIDCLGKLSKFSMFFLFPYFNHSNAYQTILLKCSNYHKIEMIQQM